MPWRRTRIAASALALGLLAGSGGAPAWATVLTFDEGRDAATGTQVEPTSSGAILPLDYGDRVTGSPMAVLGGFFTYGEAGEGFTPNVAVDVFASLATPTDPRARLWAMGYGDLVNVVFAEGPGTAGSPELFVRLSADPGYVVDLYGFDLAGFGTDYTIAGVEVLAGSVSLFSQTSVLVEGNGAGAGHTSFAFAAPLSAQELLIRLDLSNLAAGAQDNVGIDSIRFGQTPPGVPEPSPLALLLGSAALALAARAARR